MRKFSTILILCWLYVGPSCASAFADGGRIVFMDQQGDKRICVFASPDPLRAGPIDLSVLIQDAGTGMPLTNAKITVSMTPSDGHGPIVSAVATNAAATNKLLSAALLEIPKPGSWDVKINCFVEHNPTHVRFTLNAGGRSV